jgi:hypothetical protein
MDWYKRLFLFDPRLARNGIISVLSYIPISHPTARGFYFLFASATPKLYSPNAARAPRPTGSGFWVLIARGTLAPARTMLASRASSTP